MKTKNISRFILIYLLSGIAFFLLTMPFHKILAVFTVAEVRPSAVLYPFLGISYGWPAALGIMTANFISDAVNGYSTAILLEGLIPQLLYTIVPYYLWKALSKTEDHIHRLDSVSRVLKYVLVCLIFSELSAIGVGTIIYINFHTNPISAALFVLLNNFDMAIILGCPLMVISNQIISRRAGTERVLTKNEGVIIMTAIIQIVLMVVATLIIYSGGKTIGTYDIWNTVYIVGVILINVTMIMSLAIMAIIGEKKKESNEN